MIFAINASNPTSLTRLLNSMASKRNIKANRILVSVNVCDRSILNSFNECIEYSRKYRDRTTVLNIPPQSLIEYVIDMESSESVCFLTDNFSFTSNPPVCSNFIARSLRDKYDENFMFRYTNPSYPYKQEVSNRCPEFVVTENAQKKNIISGDVYLPNVLKLRMQNKVISNLLLLPTEVMTRHD